MTVGKCLQIDIIFSGFDINAPDDIDLQATRRCPLRVFDEALMDTVRVQYVSSDDESLQYKTEDQRLSGSIPTASIIAIECHRSGESKITYAASDELGDQANGHTLQQMRFTDVPQDMFAAIAAPSSFFGSRDHIDIIISTRSGTGLAENVWKQLIEPFFAANGRRMHAHYEVHLTTSETTINELVRDLVLPRANEDKRQSILLLSGDGGMVDMINTLIAGPHTEQYRKPEIGLLPFGTGNALANSSGITGDETYGLRALLRGQPREVPVFRAAFSPGARLLVNEARAERKLNDNTDGTPVAHGAVVASWGLHATLVADSDTTEYRKFGAERFKMAGKEALYPSDGSLPHAYEGKISILKSDLSEWEALGRNEHGYILATLVSHLEAGFRISPSSMPLDGRLRLVHFGRLNGDDAMGIMTKAYQNGQHVDDEKVGYEEIHGLRIDFAEDDARWRRVCIDGKIIRVEKEGWVEVTVCDRGVVDLLAS